MAKKNESQGGTIKARVLADCAHGACNSVIEVSKDLAATERDLLDTDPAAVAYAESLIIQA